MTLVYRNQKSQQIQPSSELGPGSYNLNKNEKNKKSMKSCSSFISLTKRDTFNLDRIQKQQKKIKLLKVPQSTQNSFSPYLNEQYNTSKSNKAKDQASLTGYSVINHITQKPITMPCTHLFKSRVQRFPSSQSKQINYQIVPEQKLNELILANEFKKLLITGSDIGSEQKQSKKLNLKQLNNRKKPLVELKQSFPSIPTAENSYGYRKDPLLNKLVSNQNPNKLLKIEETYENKQQQQLRNNHAFGAGYYVFIDKQSKPKAKLPHQRKQKELLNLMLHPQQVHESTISNTIQQKQNKIKLRIKLLGKNHINKIHDYENHENHINNIVNFQKLTKNKEQVDKKSVLMKHQMLRQFGRFIPQNQEPVDFLHKLQELKNQQILMKSSKIKSFSGHANSNNFNFMSKSSRFDLEKQNQAFNNPKYTDQNNQSTKLSTDPSIMLRQTGNQFQQSINNNNINSTSLHKNDNNSQSSVQLKTFNKKQPYSLGQQRFREQIPINVGPCTYYPLESSMKSNSPCLKLNENRFGNLLYSSQVPGPGQYNISSSFVNKPNHLREMYINCKQQIKQQLRIKYKKQQSMELLYQTWGKQMSFKLKQDRIMEKLKFTIDDDRINLKQNFKKTNFNVNHQNSSKNEKSRQDKQNNTQKNTSLNLTLSRTKKQLQKQRNKISKANLLNSHFLQGKERKRNIHTIHPKNIKNLYQYKQTTPSPVLAGPGAYEIRKSLQIQTFNVTYT